MKNHNIPGFGALRAFTTRDKTEWWCVNCQEYVTPLALRAIDGKTYPACENCFLNELDLPDGEHKLGDFEEVGTQDAKTNDVVPESFPYDAVSLADEGEAD